MYDSCISWTEQVAVAAALFYTSLSVPLRGLPRALAIAGNAFDLTVRGTRGVIIEFVTGAVPAIEVLSQNSTAAGS